MFNDFEEITVIENEKGIFNWNILDLLVFYGLATSKSDARRLIKQGAIKIRWDDDNLAIKKGLRFRIIDRFKKVIKYE